MSAKSFFLASGTAAIVANDSNDFRYRAMLEVLAIDMQSPTRTDDRYETQFLIESGTVEFMIGGGTAIAFEGDFARVPVGVVHAMRNIGERPARVLVRKVSPTNTQRACRVRIDFAA